VHAGFDVSGAGSGLSPPLAFSKAVLSFDSKRKAVQCMTLAPAFN
jgi:hypothetical protein